MILPRKHIVGASRSVMKEHIRSARFDVDQIVDRELRNSIADAIVHRKVEKIVRENTVDFRIELYVLTADELGEIVREAAWDLYRYGPGVLPPSGVQ